VRIILDNNIPYRFKREIADLDVTYVRELGFENLLDGPLFAAIDGSFDVLVTMDRNLQCQQNLTRRRFAVLVLRAKSNRLSDLVPLVSNLRVCLPGCVPTNVYQVAI
jgi:predicted nuclease of predicted toxin-antitoxin system